MHWYFYLAYFFGGAFLVNAVPHFVNGVSGRPFPTPFASPPGRGLSSPLVNVLWGILNLAIGYVLVCQVGEFLIRRIPDVLVLGVGGLLTAVMLSRIFRLRYGSQSVGELEGRSGRRPLWAGTLARLTSHRTGSASR